jgi:hypothetical protein
VAADPPSEDVLGIIHSARKGIAMRAIFCIFFIALLMSVIEVSVADTPISMPSKSKFCSSSGRYCAESNASDSITVVRDQASPEKAIVWSKKIFVADGFISDDGTVIASCYPGKNLVPSDADLQFVVIKFYDRRGRYKAIKLGDMYKSMDQLLDTESHKDWGWCMGFNEKGFGVKRADGSEWRSSDFFDDEPSAGR